MMSFSKLCKLFTRRDYRAVKDDDFSIVMMFRDEGQDVNQAVNSVRCFHPKVRISLISDGAVIDPYVDMFRNDPNTRVLSGVRLKLPKKGTRYIRRMFKCMARHNTKYSIKIDPDTRFVRRIQYLLDVPFSGTYLTGLWEHIQGGCQVFRRKDVVDILDSGILNSPELRDPRIWCPNKQVLRSVLTYQKETGLLNVDFLLLKVFKLSKKKIVNWNECRSEWRERPQNPNKEFAVVHPIKTTKTTEDAMIAPTTFVRQSSEVCRGSS